MWTYPTTSNTTYRMWGDLNPYEWDDSLDMLLVYLNNPVSKRIYGT
jgi:hypothetical protein